MQFICRKSEIANIPLYLVFVVFPIISALNGLVGLPRLNYEVINIALFSYIIFACLYYRPKLPTHIFLYVTFVLGAVCIKYLSPILFNCNVVWRALFIDIKWLVYLLLALLWIGALGYINLDRLYKLGKAYAIIYISYVVLMTLKTGVLSRDNSGLLSECNYDCYLLLIPFCFYFDRPKNIKDFIIFFLAIILSTSKTGVVSMFAILCYRKFRKSRFKLLIILGAGILACLWIYIYFLSRGITSSSDVDRVVYFLQFFNYLQQASWQDILLGIFPGRAMIMEPLPAFVWSINKFNEMNHITGCFPFIFHSTYMRLALVWGLPLLLVLIIMLLHLFRKTKYPPLKYLLIVFFLESISLSTLSLENISFIFFVVFISTYLLIHKSNFSKQ